MIKNNIGEMIEKSGLRRDFIAKHVNVSTKQISNWIAGRSFPTFEKAFILAKVLNCKVDDLAKIVEDEKE